MEVKKCMLCPRGCGADRTRHQGYCGGGGSIRVARAALHQWEEPCISGTRGSGTVFFSGCQLRCCYCQNHQISAGNFGREISTQRLADIFLELQAQGAHNINLVSPTHYVPWIIDALYLAKPALTIPVVYNSSGYEALETLRMLDGLVDVYLPDLKYFDGERAGRYSCAPDYFEFASQAVLEMYRQVGCSVFNKNGLLRKGLVIRHLVLPKGYHDSIKLLQWTAENLPAENILISVMSQYTPFHQSERFPEINRRVSTFEYRRVLEAAQDMGLHGFMQEKSSAREEYTPPFDLQGL